jgi:protein-tyrosine phosphatase
LGLVKATNARDLGGYSTVDGRLVRRGVLFRSNTLHRLSAGDVAVLGGLGLACVIDFRHPDERELAGPDRLPSPAPAHLVELPIFEPEHDVFVTIGAAFGGRSTPELMARLRADHDTGGSAATMVELYRWFVSSPIARDTFARAVRLIASADTLPLLFHCSAGKDRTGWLAAVVLSALGVDRDTVVADYMRTNAFNHAGNAYMLSTLADRVDDPSVLVPLLEARQEYLDAAFAEADRRFGGMDGYLRDGLAMDDPTMNALRAHLLG